MCYVVPPASPVVNGVAVGVSIALVVLVVNSVVCIMVPRFRRKMTQLFGEIISVELDNNHPEDGGEAVIASDHPTRQSQEKVHMYKETIMKLFCQYKSNELVLTNG